MLCWKQSSRRRSLPPGLRTSRSRGRPTCSPGRHSSQARRSLVPWVSTFARQSQRCKRSPRARRSVPFVRPYVGDCLAVLREFRKTNVQGSKVCCRDDSRNPIGAITCGSWVHGSCMRVIASASVLCVQRQCGKGLHRDSAISRPDCSGPGLVAPASVIQPAALVYRLRARRRARSDVSRPSLQPPSSGGDTPTRRDRWSIAPTNCGYSSWGPVG